MTYASNNDHPSIEERLEHIEKRLKHLEGSDTLRTNQLAIHTNTIGLLVKSVERITTNLAAIEEVPRK